MSRPPLLSESRQGSIPSYLNELVNLSTPHLESESYYIGIPYNESEPHGTVHQGCQRVILVSNTIHYKRVAV